MSKKSPKSYTEEFKQSSAQLASTSEQSVSQTARDLGINANTLHGWVKHYYPKKVPVIGASSDFEKENKKLRKENSRLRQERDILKKATAYFANETL